MSILFDPGQVKPEVWFMKHSIKQTWILAAAVGAVSLCVSLIATAQYRVETGHANDVNNRVGSSGLNGGGSNRGQFNGVTGNDIVTGNVTAGKQFRGNVPYTDARAFRGNLAEH